MTESIFLSSRQVRQRYGGRSQMWLHRRLHDNSGFPRPVYLGRQRFWKLEDLERWEREQAAKSLAA
jgi:predicted DNA-binding transcriptional regulator AlpA